MNGFILIKSWRCGCWSIYTAFFNSRYGACQAICLTCIDCITFSCDCQVVIFLTLQGRFVLRYFFQLVYILSHVCVLVKDFLKTFRKMFSCVTMSYWHYLYYHVIVWLSIIDFKKYDKIITQTYVRVCSAQIVQNWFYRTFVLFKNNG